MNERDQDERDLEMLRMRGRRYTAAQIGARFGLTAASVRVRTTDIQNADISVSGEPSAAVRASYWEPATRGKHKHLKARK